MSDKKDYVVLRCEQCKTISKVYIEFISDVYDAKCPNCSSSHVFIQEIYQHDAKPCNIVLGRGGCSQK